jgi:hypothetical protein
MSPSLFGSVEVPGVAKDDEASKILGTGESLQHPFFILPE